MKMSAEFEKPTPTTDRFIVYVVESSATTKRYIGITSRSLKIRWSQHRAACTRNSDYAIHRAMRRHGISTFTIREIGTARDWNSLCAMERKYIAEYKSFGLYGYNMTEGGEGSGSPSDEVRRKIGNSLKGRKLSDETRNRMSISKQAMTDETKNKMSESRKGKKRKPLTDAQKQNLSRIMIARYTDPELLNRHSAIMKTKYMSIRHVERS